MKNDLEDKLKRKRESKRRTWERKRWRESVEGGIEEDDGGCLRHLLFSQTGRGSWFCFAPGHTEC